MKGISPYTVRAGRLKRRVRIVAVTQNPLEVLDRKTGEVRVATPYVGHRAWRDTSYFVKVYDPEALVDMKPCELKVFMYVLTVLDFDGQFIFDESACMEFTRQKRRMTYYGLNGLLEKDYVRKDRRGLYWVNPNIAFRGSRDDLLEIDNIHEEGDNIHEE